MPAIDSPASRRQLAAAYAAGVAAALIPPAATRGPAEALTVAPPDLLAASRGLGAAAQTGLAATDPLDMAAAEVQLLAGAALDLALAGHWAGPAAPQVRGYGAEPALAGPVLPAPDLFELQTIIAAPEAYLVGGMAGRGLRSLSARRTPLAQPTAQFADTAHAALAGIRADVVTAGGHAVEGLLLLDAALLREAIGVVGGDLAGKLGLDLAGLSAKALSFLLAANDKILALVGLDAMSEARKQLERWLDQLRGGTLFPNLVSRILTTAAIEAEIKGWLAVYDGTGAGLLPARGEIDQLAGHFAAKMRVADKVTAGLALVKVVPPLMTPAGRVAVAAVYLGLLAYIVGSGYDHVDSDRIKLLDRVEGVRGISQRALEI